MNARRFTATTGFIGDFDELRRGLAALIALVAAFLGGLEFLSLIAVQDPLTLPVLMLSLVFVAVAAAALRRVALRVISDVLILGMAVSLLMLYESFMALALIALVICAVSPFIASRPVYWMTLAFVAGRVVTFEVIRLQGTDFTVLSSSIPFVIASIILSVLVRLFRARMESFIEAARSANAVVAAVNRISAALARHTDESALVKSVPQLVHEELGFYHVRLYLSEAGSGEATLVSAAGAQPAQPPAASIAVTTASLIGRALLAGEAIVARADTSRGLLTDHQHLPATQAEAVIPLLDRDRVIGALDLHSRSAVAFSSEALTALDGLAHGIAQALRQARITHEQQAALLDKRRLAQENEVSTREIDRLNRQLTRQAWLQYTRSPQTIAGVTLTPQGFRPGAEWTEVMTQAIQRRRMASVAAQDGTRTVALPIELRNEVIGALQVDLSASAYVSDTIDLLRTVTERLAISLENARLFEEAQAATEQEQRINAITTEIQGVDSVEAMLQRALEGLSDALGTDDAVIRLGGLAQPAGNGGRNAAARS